MTLAILCIAAFAMVTYALSAAVALTLRALSGTVAGLAPVAQARLYLAAALLPFAGAAAVLIAALAPSFGWITDHCTRFVDPHTHPHICSTHHVATWPAVPLTALACFITFRFLMVVARQSHALALGQRARRELDRASEQGPGSGTRVLPSDGAQAFVLGLFRPTLYVTRGLVCGALRAHLDAVMAHERAHLRRFDPLRRFVAGTMLSFHLPGIARWLDRCLARAQELAADEIAAEDLGSRERVARALVALAKARTKTPATAFSFAGSDVETRVVQLMDERGRRDRPKLSTLLVGAGLILVIVAIAADGVHHGVERLLGAMGS